ncbi:MAG: hypothetical protein WC080_04185 [Patescibacteria group bacterium]|jgi:DNA polymerase III delta prime subunit
MEGVNFIEKIAAGIGKPKKASSYLFYVTSQGQIEDILKYFSDTLRPGISDILLIRPEESLGKKNIISIKQVRELIHFLNLSPEGKAKIAAVICAETFNKESANAFLKTLEEPPKDAVIILFAFLRALLPTIVSRCMVKNFQVSGGGSSSYDGELAQKLKGNFKDVSDTIELYIKDEKIDELIYTLEYFAREKLLSLKTADAARLLKETEKVKSQIKSNANPKLAIETLVLKNRKLIRK